MKLQNLFLMTFVAAALFAASPAMAETLFYDDFEGFGSSTHFAIDSTADPGTWTRSGDGVYDFRFAPTVLSLPSVDGSGYYGSTLVGASGTQHTYINANFAPQSNPADLIRLEVDFAAIASNSTMEIAIGSGGTPCNPISLGSNTGPLNTWHHLAIEYYPGAATYDLYVNDLELADLPMATIPTTVDSFYFHGTGGNWASFDNVSVTVIPAEVPEPSTVALLVCGLFGLLFVWKKCK